MGRSIAAVAVGITGIVVPPGRRFAQGMPLPVAWAFERSRCRGGRFAWFDRAIAMSQNKIGVSRKMSIEYPYKQLPCQTQGGFLQTALSTVTRRSRSCSSPVLLCRVTPDRVLAFMGSNALGSDSRGWLARNRLFQIPAQILEDLLLSLLNFEQDRFSYSGVILPWMDLPRLQQNFSQIRNALLREQHLVVGLNHGNSSSTIPRF